MASLISPAEALGLSGAALDSRCRRAAHSISEAAYRNIVEQMRTSAVADGLIYERDGKAEPIPIMLRPILIRREQLTYIHYVCQQVLDATKRFPALYLEDPQIREILAVDRDEASWLKDIWTAQHGRINPVYGRLDAPCDFASAAWKDSLKFMEANLSSVGGIQYSPAAEKIVMEGIVPALVAHDPDLAIELPPDQRDLFVQVLIDHARALGRDACHICFIEAKYEHDGPAEQPGLIRFLAERFGLTIVHADPRELRVLGDEVYYGDTRIDVAYRDYELRDFIELEKTLGRPLDGIRLLLKQNRLISSTSGDFDHKSGFEILTDPAIAGKLFSSDVCKILDRHVLWTRIVRNRNTVLPNHTAGDLLGYARRNREQLVLKPNRSYGGEGVAIGALTSDGEWERLLHEAALVGSDPNVSWVIQSATSLPVCEFPVAGPDGRIHSEPFYAVMGFAPTDNGLGILCRVSQKQVVNVAQHGGLAAVLIADPPGDLRIPSYSANRRHEAVKSLRAQIAELRHLDQAIALLEWDEETFLPHGGLAQRGEQTATLGGIRHGILVSEQLAELLEKAAADARENTDLARELSLIQRERSNALAVPESLVRHFANAKVRTLGAWEEARGQNDFTPFAQPFGELVNLMRERATCLSSGGEKYDALLDEYEPGMTHGRLGPLLAEMRERLVPLVRHASEQAMPDVLAMAGRPFPAAEQWALSRLVLQSVGFDFERGRLDATTHPFTTMLGHNDVRLTSRVNEQDVTVNLLSTMHEAGHALYDLGLSAADRDSYLGDGPSMGLHEAQARLWENHVGRSQAFSTFLFPHMKTLFPSALDGLDAGTLWRALNRICPGTIRTEADEMSYHLHIILRTELEVALISGALEVKDLLPAWNERSQALLGLQPASARAGVLQDVHWAQGMFGYFATYTVGSLYAAQLVETYSGKNDLALEIGKGQFGRLLGWLQKNIHEPGNRLPAEALVTRVTGRGLDTAAYFRHVQSPERSWNGR